MGSSRSSGLRRSKLGAASTLLIALILVGWAVSATVGGAAPFHSSRQHVRHAPDAKIAVDKSFDLFALTARPLQKRAEQRLRPIPSAAVFRESEGRGLLTSIWVNGTGPYTFAIDTGAGATILSPRVAGAARVTVESGGRGIRLGGLSGMGTASGRKAFVDSLAIGSRENLLSSKGLIIVAEGLPRDVDGILDPTEAFWPLGYRLDLPRGSISAFDPRATPVRREDAPADGAVVEWLDDTSSRRPFVMLRGGRRALLDTGSAFGLAVTPEAARALGIDTGEGRTARNNTRDLAGGSVASRRIRPATIYLGALALRGVPADLLMSTEAGAPILLGRDALRPFRLTFDPLNRLIKIEP